MGSGSSEEIESDGIHAIAQTGRTWAVVEYMAKMRVAALAGYCDALQAEGAVLALGHVVARDRPPEARPARTGVELGARVEQLRSTADAGIQTICTVAVVGTAEGALRRLVTRHLIGEQRQLLPPLGIRLDDARDARGSLTPAIRPESLDGHAVRGRGAGCGHRNPTQG